MENDNLAPIIVSAATTAAKGIKDLAPKIRDSAKAKKAQKIADAGGYWTLRPYQKSLINIPDYIVKQVAGQGITQEAVIALPEQSANTSNTQIINQLKMLSGNTSSGSVNPTGNPMMIVSDEPQETTGFNKKYILYILVVSIVAFGVYYITKKK